MSTWFRKIFTFKNKRRMPLWIAWPLALLGRLLFFTCRVKIEGCSEPWTVNVASPAIFACWHNRVIFGVPQLPLLLRRNLSLLISASRDGEYIATLAKLFQFQVVRGSSSRGGVAALMSLKHEIQKNRSLIITVDGPRGPKYCVHSGVVALAALTNAPIVPLCFNYSRYLELKSWDRMQIPLPFSKVTVVFSQPIKVDRIDDREATQELVRQQLLQITQDRNKKNAAI
jgi:lysophospholipid acyltransferase (LPLAT)-like uncharacterized protein